MWKRFLVAAIVIAGVSGAATATVALNTASDLAGKIFKEYIKAPPGVLGPPTGGPQTFLILGSDRRARSKDSFDRSDPPHSDTMLIVRFDPEQGQTSVMSIPRDLMVNIKTPQGQLYPNEKINAAYTIGSKLSGTKGGMLLAAETIEREVFPGLKFNNIVDVNFRGFIQVVDTLGCAYVNVDHRYIGGGALGENFSSINLQPGYQKLCYENALSYVRYRHTDSDFVRVARQQDFMRSLRGQLSAEPERIIDQMDSTAKAVGHAIVSTIKGSAGTLIELAKLVAFSQSKPLRQVKFLTTNVNAQFNGGSYVTSTPELEKQTLNIFLHGHEQLHLSSSAPSAHSSHSSSHHHRSSGGPSTASLGLVATSGESEIVKAAVQVPFRVLYPRLQTAQAEQQTVRPYDLRNQQGHLHHAYVIVWRQNTLGGYYDIEGTDWLNPPLFAHAHTQTIGGRDFLIVDDGSHIHAVGWRSGRVLYWVTNTLLEDLSNAQMTAIAKSAQPLH